MEIFDIAICTIFAREVLEATIVIGQYRTVLLRSPDWQEPEKQIQGLRAINTAAITAALVALVMILAVAIPLGLLSQNLSPKVIQIVEGISKIVAAICITQLSIKIPRLLGLYPSKKKNAGLDASLSLRNIRFNVAWNIWREVAETGAYLLPYILAGHISSIYLSSVIGIIVGFVVGISVYIANKKQKNMKALAIFMASLTGMLAIGLFTGGCHEFEKALGPTKIVWKIEGEFWDQNKLPMTILKPFGYSSSRTVLQIVAFWSWILLTALLHYRKYRQSKATREQRKNVENQVLSIEEGEAILEAEDNIEIGNKRGGMLGIDTEDSSRNTTTTQV